jgi:hypothetical protein
MTDLAKHFVPLEEFELEGFLVAGDDDSIHLLLPPYVLQLRRDDILALEELPAHPRQRTEAGIAVRIRVQKGCRLSGVTSSCDYERRLWRRRRPFVIATRHEKAPMRDDGSYGELENAFLLERGIEVKP